MSRTVFLWDIDGTILLSGGAGIASFNRVFEELFSEPGIWQDLHPDGRTDDSIIEELFSKRLKRLPTKSEMATIVKRYNEVMEEELWCSANFRLMPQVHETLRMLSQNPKISLGIATGNYEITAINKLKRAKLHHYFSYGGYGSDSRDRTQLTQIALNRAIQHLGVPPEDVFLIGDTVHDIRCGRQIGAKTIGVCTGMTPKESLEEEGANWVIRDLSEFHLVADLAGNKFNSQAIIA